MTQKIVTAKDAQIPALGFGTFRLLGKVCEDSVTHALDVGYRHIDTAQIYKNEEEVGRAIQKSAVSRDDIFLTTKVWFENARAKDVRASTEDSLKKLGTDAVDLLLFHWPVDDVPLEETLGEMARLKEEGKTRFIGVSNFTKAMVDEAQKLTTITTNQVEFHALLDQRLLLKQAQDLGHTLTAYSPLAQGTLFSNSAFKAIANDLSIAIPELALAWLLHKDQVLAIPRSSKAANISSNFNALAHSLSSESIERIDALMGSNRVVDPPFAPTWDAL